MWMGGKVVGGVGGVGTGRMEARLTCCGQSPVSGDEEVVAMMSIPVVSRPMKKSRPSASSGLGMIVLPMGTLPAGTIFRNKGGVVTAPEERTGVTAELSQVLNAARLPVAPPPANRAKEPVELKTIEVAGAASG